MRLPQSLQAKPMMRGWAAVFVIAVVYPAAFSMEEGTPLVEDVTLDTLVDLSNATNATAVSAATSVKYGEIRGFALKAGYTETTGKTLGECKASCDSDTTCKSVNYALVSKEGKSQVCRISSMSIQYSEEFVFKTKVHLPQGRHKYPMISKKKWHTFPGLSLVTKDGTKESGATLKQCEDICMKAKKGCDAIAYRARDKLCLMTKNGIAYDDHFDYYEKKASIFVMPKFKVAPNVTVPPPANKTETTVVDSTGKKVPCPKAIDDPAIVALEIKEKARVRQAHDASAHAKVVDARAKATMARLKLSAKQQIAAAMAGEKSQLSGMEKTTLKKEDEQLAKAQGKTKVEFLASELRAKANHAKNSAARAAERASKTDGDLKRRARQEAASALGQGRKAGEIAVKKYHVSEKEKKAEVANKKPLSAASFAARIAALKKQEAVKKAAKKKELKEESVKLKQSNAALKQRLKLRGEKAIDELKKDSAAYAKEMQQKHDEGKTERGMKRAAAERVKAKELRMKNKVAFDRNKLNAEEMAHYDKEEQRVINEEGQVASSIGKIQLRTKVMQDEVGVDAKDKFKLLQSDRRARLAKQKMKDAGALAETHAVLKSKERMIKKATEPTINKYRREKQIQAEKAEKPKIKKEQKRLAALRASWAKEKKTEYEELHYVKRKSAQDMARAHAELREVQRRAAVQLSHARTKAREVTAKAHEESTLMRAKAKAEAQFHTTKATELGEKTKEKRWKASMKEQDIVAVNVKADVAAFVDSGPGKHGVNYKQLQRNAELMRVRMEGLRKVYEAEQRTYDKKRREYHADVHKEHHRYHQANERGNKLQHRERQAKAGQGPKTSEAVQKQQEKASKAKARTQKANSGVPAGFARMPNSNGKTCDGKSRGFKRVAKPDLATCVQQCKGSCRYVTYNTEKDCDTSIDCRMVTHPRAASANPRIFKKNGEEELDTEFVQIRTGARRPNFKEKKSKIKEKASKVKAKAKSLMRRRKSSSNKPQVWCTEGVNGACRDASTSCRTWRCSDRTKDKCYAWRNNRHLHPSHKAQVFGQGNCAKEKGGKERKNKAAHAAHRERHAKHHAAREKHDKIHERRRKADEKFDKARNRRHHEFHSNLHKLRIKINQAEARRRKEYDAWRHAAHVHHEAVRKAQWALRQPANQKYGELPRYAREQGYLRLQRGSHHEQNALLKFPLRLLRPSDTIVAAHLKLFKYGGWGGPAEVRTIPCDWSRGGVTYTNTMDLAPSLRANTGTGTTVDWSTYPPTTAVSQFSNSQNTWTKIKLKGDVLNKARLTGNHLCLEVKGGPTKNACVVSSELTRQAPVIELYVKQGSSPLAYGQGDVMKDKNTKRAKKAGAASAIDTFEQKTRNQLIDKFTKEILARKAKSMKSDLKKMQQSSANKMDKTKAKAAAKIKKAASGAIDKQVKAKTLEIEKAENAKVESEVQRSKLKGQQLVILKTKLHAKAQHNIAEKTKAAIKMLEAKAQGVANKEQVRLQARQQAEKMNEKVREADARKKSVTLTSKEKAEVKRRTKFELAIRMAEYMRKKANGGKGGGSGKGSGAGSGKGKTTKQTRQGSGKGSAAGSGSGKVTQKKSNRSVAEQGELELLDVGESRGGAVVMLGA